ncbi:hypothetical protein N2152v2_010814 [Parachlorella kessleri]
MDVFTLMGDFIAEEGQFVNDEWVGDVMACTVDQARAAAAESDIAAQMARVFELRDEKAAALQPASLSHASSSSSRAAHPRGRRRQRQQQLSLEASEAAAAEWQQSVPAAAAATSARAGVPAAAAAAPARGGGGRGGPLGFLAGLLRRS